MSEPAASGLPPIVEAMLPSLMREAIAEAGAGDFPFGTVIADLASGEILARAGNSGSTDRTGHGEMNALRRLGPRGGSGAVLITTAEPCPMCAAASFWAGIPAIVYGTSIARLMGFGWTQLDLACEALLTTARPPRPVLVVGGLLSAETDLLYASGPPPDPGGTRRKT